MQGQTPNCPRCGAIVSTPGATNCVYCGSPLAAAPPAQQAGFNPYADPNPPSPYVQPAPPYGGYQSFDSQAEQDRQRVLSVQRMQAQQQAGGAKTIIVVVALLVPIVLMAVGATVFVMTKADADSEPAVTSAAVPVVGVDAAPPPDLERGEVALTWKGKVTSTVGAGPAVGSACTLTVTRKTADDDDPPTNFTCGGKVLYDSTKESGVMVSASSFELREYPVTGELNTFEYQITDSDLGQRTGDRNQISVNSREHVAEAIRDVAPTFHVTASLDRMSAVRHGKPIDAANVPLFHDVIRRTARVTSKTGTPPFTSATCELLVSPGDAKYPCRSRITCGGKEIYGVGSTGFETCKLDAKNEPVSFDDKEPTSKDGDPELTVNLTTGQATLGDTGPNYSVSFVLEK